MFIITRRNGHYVLDIIVNAKQYYKHWLRKAYELCYLILFVVEGNFQRPCASTRRQQPFKRLLPSVPLSIVFSNSCS